MKRKGKRNVLLISLALWSLMYLGAYGLGLAGRQNVVRSGERMARTTAGMEMTMSMDCYLDAAGCGQIANPAMAAVVNDALLRVDPSGGQDGSLGQSVRAAVRPALLETFDKCGGGRD